MPLGQVGKNQDHVQQSLASELIPRNNADQYNKLEGCHKVSSAGNRSLFRDYHTSAVPVLARYTVY